MKNKCSMLQKKTCSLKYRQYSLECPQFVSLRIKLKFIHYLVSYGNKNTYPFCSVFNPFLERMLSRQR